MVSSRANFGFKSLLLVIDLLLLKRCEAAELHLENRICLRFIEAELEDEGRSVRYQPNLMPGWPR